MGYFGDGPWAHNALDGLFADPSTEVMFVCVRSDTPDQILKAKAHQHAVDFLIHPDINSDEFFERIEGYNCNLLVSMSFNQIFRKRLIDLPVEGIINCHAGRLPFYRGRNILNWALINDEKEFGITVHYVDQGVDTGDIIIQEQFPISDEDNYATLLERAHENCPRLLLEAIKLIQCSQVMPFPQRDISSNGTYCSTRIPGDEKLDWNQSSRNVFNFVRAICKPGPQARCMLNGNEVLINKVELVDGAPIYKGIPGAVLKKTAAGLLVKILDSYVRITELSSSLKINVGCRFT